MEEVGGDFSHGMHNDRGLLQLIIVAKLPKLDRQAGDMVAAKFFGIRPWIKRRL